MAALGPSSSVLAKVLLAALVQVGAVRPRAMAMAARVPGPAAFRRRLQTPSSALASLLLGAADVAPLVPLARGGVGVAPEGVAASATVRLGTGEAAPARARRTCAEAGEARTALCLGAAVVKPVRLLPRRLAEGQRTLEVRDVGGDVEGRHEVATLPSAPKGLRGALAGATRTTRAGRRPLGEVPPQGHAVGGPETPGAEIAEMEVPEADTEVRQRRVATARRLPWATAVAVPRTEAVLAAVLRDVP